MRRYATDEYRLEQLTAAQPTRCATRLGVALQQGFVRYPAHADELPDTPVADARHHDVVALYRSLPPVRRAAE